eukprot:206475-Chlamydomonas_euryale.AAC.1
MKDKAACEWAAGARGWSRFSLVRGTGFHKGVTGKAVTGKAVSGKGVSPRLLCTTFHPPSTSFPRGRVSSDQRGDREGGGMATRRAATRPS